MKLAMLLIVAFILAAGCVEVGTDDGAPIGGGAGGIVDDVEPVQEIVSEKDLEDICAQVAEENEVHGTVCEAFISLDPEKCETIASWASVDRAMCYSLVASEREDPSFCRSDECYTFMALKMKNASICSMAEFSTRQEECRGVLSYATKEDYCIEGKDSRCFGKLALALKDESICEKVKEYAGEYSKSQCRASIADLDSTAGCNGRNREACLQAALREGDASVCGALEDAFERGVCYNNFLKGYPTTDLGICGKVNSNVRDSCFFIIASRKADFEACESLRETGGQWTRCVLYAVARIKGGYGDVSIPYTDIPLALGYSTV